MHFLAVVHTGDGRFTLADEVVIVDVVTQQTHGYKKIYRSKQQQQHFKIKVNTHTQQNMRRNELE